jgi:hypothetical protein
VEDDSEEGAMNLQAAVVVVVFERWITPEDADRNLVVMALRN